MFTEGEALHPPRAPIAIQAKARHRGRSANHRLNRSLHILFILSGDPSHVELLAGAGGNCVLRLH